MNQELMQRKSNVSIYQGFFCIFFNTIQCVKLLFELVADSPFGSRAHESHLTVHSFGQPRAKGYIAWNEFDVADRWWDKEIRSVTLTHAHFPFTTVRRETSLLLANKWPNSRRESLASLRNVYGVVFYVARIKEPRYKNYSH